MKKIIAALDGLKYSKDTASYATHLAREANAHLVGVFLDDLAYTSYNVYQLLVKKDVPEKKLAHYQLKDKETRDKAALAFGKVCEQAKLNYTIHRDRNTALRELLQETIYADLLVIDKRETFTHYEEPVPTLFVRDLLAETQCPVFLAASTYKPIDSIVMLYDGQPSSVYAIKMFSYLFPFLKHLPIEVVTIRHSSQDRHLPNNALIKEFMKRHFPKSTYHVIKGSPEENIVAHISEKEGHPLVVLGAYHRGMVSRWFRTSMADILMKELKCPLFVAHNKS